MQSRSVSWNLIFLPGPTWQRLMADNRKHRTVPLNPDVVLRLMRQRGWSIEELASRAVLSTGTVSAALNGKHATYWRTAEKIRRALQLDNIETLLGTNQPSEENGSPRRIHEWLLDRAESKWITASNQLQFRIWKLQHEHLPKFGRGKCYDLEQMASDERTRCRVQLLRHAEVCAKIGRHTNISNNITTCEDPQNAVWWVIDEWINGTSLSERILQNSFERPQAVVISLQIAEGLRALHLNNMIRRELSPHNILLETDTERVILTEFELAKLLDGRPTVSKDDWPVDPCRAPEAGADDVDHRADIYSWGRITIQLLTGTLPMQGDELTVLKSAKLPKKVESLLTNCVAISRRTRPQSIDEVTAVMSAWKVLT